MKRYDAAIIGGGPGGYVCALRLAQLGKSVALVEREHLGGTCLNYGCIPTKSLLANARAIEALGQGDTYGFSVDNVRFDYEKAFSRSRAVAQKLERGVQGLMRRNRIDVFADTACLEDAHTVVTQANGTLYAETIVVATGSSARRLGLFEGVPGVMTARDALLARSLPRRVAIVGAGVIGMEFAYLYGSYGCEVTMIEALDRVLTGFDPELGEFARQNMRARGVTIHTGATLTAAAYVDGEIRLTCQNGGESMMVPCDGVLCSVGVSPNTAGLGLERAGVALDGRGYVVTDELMRTSAPSVYAIGDVNGKMPLAHAASAQGIVAAEAICGMEPEPVRYEQVPRCVYCEPEIAAVGLDEKGCGAREVCVGRFSFGGNGKALADGAGQGFVKVIADARTGEILGAHIAGAQAGELIPQCAALMRAEITSDELLHAVFPHPSLSEALWEAVNDAAGQAIHR